MEVGGICVVGSPSLTVRTVPACGRKAALKEEKRGFCGLECSVVARSSWSLLRFAGSVTPRPRT